MEQRYKEQSAKKDAILQEIEDKKARARKITTFMHTLADSDLVLESWDEKLWLSLIEKGTVLPDGSINFLFKNGTEILAAG